MTPLKYTSHHRKPSTCTGVSLKPSRAPLTSISPQKIATLLNMQTTGPVVLRKVPSFGERSTRDMAALAAAIQKLSIQENGMDVEEPVMDIENTRPQT